MADKRKSDVGNVVPAEEEPPLDLEKLREDFARLKKSREDERKEEQQKAIAARLAREKLIQDEYQRHIHKRAHDMMRELEQAIPEKDCLKFLICWGCDPHDHREAMKKANDIVAIIQSNGIDARVKVEEEPDVAGSMSDCRSNNTSRDVYVTIGII